MAQGGRNKSQSPGKSSGKAKRGSQSQKSLASARRAGSDRMQYIIGGVAIVIIAAIVVVGLIIHGNKTKVQAAGYGDSVASTATFDDGVITVSNGNPDLVLDLYEDAICPICAELEHQYGQQIAQAIDDGQLTVRYHMVNMLDGSSASGDYSSRAYAAMADVAKNDGADPGVLLNFHASLFSDVNQPKENGSKDLSNDDLADLAKAVGASEKTQQEIADGAGMEKAKSQASDNFESLKKASANAGKGSVGTPSVFHDGTFINWGDTNWLTSLLPADYTPSAKPSQADGDN